MRQGDRLVEDSGADAKDVEVDRQEQGGGE